MLTFTLDTNCLIDIEENRKAAPDVRALVGRHAAGTALVRIAATTAAERQQDLGYLPNFGVFLERIKAAGLGHLDLIKPVAALDLVYRDWCALGADDGSDEADLRRIHAVLFPTPYDYDRAVPPDLTGAPHDKAVHDWRDRRLDGLALHCHIRSGGDVFVTSDTDFLKVSVRESLAALGAALIFPPADAEKYAAAHEA